MPRALPQTYDAAPCRPRRRFDLPLLLRRFDHPLLLITPRRPLQAKKACKWRGLSAHGKAKELLERLVESMGGEPESVLTENAGTKRILPRVGTTARGDPPPPLPAPGSETTSSI